MIALKTVLAVSAVASASALSAFSGFPGGEAQSATFAERFSVSSQMLVPPTKAIDDRAAAARKTDNKASLDKLCADQQWPYIAPECLVAGKGLTVRRPARTVSVERVAER
jgi:hypothetical protein